MTYPVHMRGAHEIAVKEFRWENFKIGKVLEFNVLRLEGRRTDCGIPWAAKPEFEPMSVNIEDWSVHTCSSCSILGYFV